MYDVIIVGARCAGASLASFLGRRGHSVLLVDQFPYPNATTSTHILGESDVYERLGILGKMESAGAPFLTRMRVDLEGTVFESDITVTKRALGLRRELLDPLLLQSAARHRNVEVRLNTRVTKILLENGRAAGIECRRKDGQLQRFAGKAVIGADGRYSAVAKGVRAPLETETERPLHGVAYAYLSGVHRLPVPAVEWYWKGSSVVLCNPIDGLMHCAAIMYSPEEQERMARLGRGEFMERLLEIRTLAPRLAESGLEGAVRGIPPGKSFIRKAYGCGWALAGDAGAFLHPVAGVGIDNAVCTAEVLADELHAFFTGAKEWEEAMRSYEEQRNNRIYPQYRHSLATLETAGAPFTETSAGALKMLATFPSLVKKIGLQAEAVISFLSGGQNHD
ncbi:NAD(P)/FAD-dependent oxidoreductase [Paenibacillus chitinolyticus]